MHIREVTNLRREGRLNEAYEMASEDLQQDTNEWTRMSMFWVLRDMVQNIYIPAHDDDKSKECLQKMAELLPNMMDDDRSGEKAYKRLQNHFLPYADVIDKARAMSDSNPIEAYQYVEEEIGTDGRILDPMLQEGYGWIIYKYLRANADNLNSIDIRRLLRDYMHLENKRPSLLHSVFLKYAIDFAKNSADFNFYRFFKMWGAKNLREEDLKEQNADGNTYPSLLSRICRVVVDANGEFDVDEFVSEFDNKDLVIEQLRESWFWKLMNLQRANNINGLWTAFDYYASHYSSFGPSHWHSEILKIANRFMGDDEAYRFMLFMMKWNATGNFLQEDFQNERADDGQEYPSLAVKSAKKCFDFLNNSSQRNMELVKWLKNLYVQIGDTNDDWSRRRYAMLCMWSGDVDIAIDTYKSLLISMGDKYYIWYELSQCITDDLSLKIGLLLKAKSLEHNEDFIGDIHLSLARLWLASSEGNRAKAELQAYAKNRQEKGKPIKEEYRQLQERLLVTAEETAQVDERIYIEKAENFVYRDYDWHDFVLVDKWKSAKDEYCKFADYEGLSMSFKVKRFPTLKRCEVGDIVKIRYYISDGDTAPSAQNISKKTYTPLMVAKTNNEKWSILPLQYGVVEYVNHKKQTIHILTQHSEATFYRYKDNPPEIDSFVKFRAYKEMHDEETRLRIVQIDVCIPEEALSNMKSRVVIVDDVNEAKQLFHVVLGPGLVSDIVRFTQTGIRPSVGDYLRITYCIKKDKNMKKRIKFLKIEETEETCPGVKRTITGTLSVKYKYGDYDSDILPDFAFINDEVYVHRNLLRKYNIVEDCEVIAKVVLGRDNKWKVYDLEFPSDRQSV